MVNEINETKDSNLKFFAQLKIRILNVEKYSWLSNDCRPVTTGEGSVAL